MKIKSATESTENSGNQIKTTPTPIPPPEEEGNFLSAASLQTVSFPLRGKVGMGVVLEFSVNSVFSVAKLVLQFNHCKL